MTTRKLIIGTKAVGGLPKEKPPKTSLFTRAKDALAFKRLRFTLEEEDLIVRVYGRETVVDAVEAHLFEEFNLEEERVIGTATIPTRVEIRPEKAYWIKAGGPDEIRVQATRHLLVTRVTSTLPLSLQELRPGHEQDLPISHARILPGDSVTVAIPARLISFG